MTELLFDNLNVLRTDLTEAVNTYGSLKKIPAKLGDVLLDYLVYAYVMGVHDVDEEFTTTTEIKTEDIYRIVFEKVADKDFAQRVDEYVGSDGTVEDIMRIAETDTTRIYNEAALDTAEKVGATYKRWNAVGDDRTRETHEYLQGVRMPIDARFYTYDGDSALSPGGFTLPENNCGCRCWLTFS